MRRDVSRRVFRGRELAVVSAQARAALGDDALILRTTSRRVGAGTMIEIVAASAGDVARFERRVTPRTGLGTRDSGLAPGLSETRVPSPESRPLVLALVGPTGAGKTTTAVK